MTAPPTPDVTPPPADLHTARDAYEALAGGLRTRYPLDEHVWGPPLGKELPELCGVHDTTTRRGVYRDVPCAPRFFNEEIGYRDGYVAGHSGHAVAGSEWRVGFRVCERCG